MPQLDFGTYGGQIFWLFVSFSVLYLFVRYFFFPKIEMVMDSRADFISDNIAASEKAIKEAKKIRAEIDLKLSEVNNKASYMLSDAERQIKLFLDAKAIEHENEIARTVNAEYKNIMHNASLEMNALDSSVFNDLKYEIIKAITEKQPFISSRWI